VRPNLENTTLSTFSGFAAIVLWSTTFALARSVSEQVGSLTAGAFVYLFGGALCFLRLWWLKIPLNYFCQLPRRYLFGCGALFVFYTVAIYLTVGLAKDREQILEIALVNYLWPAATVLFSIVLLNKKARPLLVLGTVLAVVGVMLVMTQGAQVSWVSFVRHVQSNPVAFLLVFTAAIAWALYSNLTRRWSAPGTRGAVELFILATGCVLLVLRLLTTEPMSWRVQTAGEASLLGAITGLAYTLWDAAMRKGNLLLVAVGSYFTPLLSTLVSSAYLKVAPGSKLWIGCLLIVAGSLISWRSVSDR
jgi:drug/metabolite transporter (DMT)-like permease